MLLKLERSRTLAIWWLALHLLIVLALVMTNIALALAAVPVLALHARRRWPASTGLIVISGGRFGLPAEGRLDLSLDGRSRGGRWWLELVFSDLPQAKLLVLRDQLDRGGWRRLRLAIAESV